MKSDQPELFIKGANYKLLQPTFKSAHGECFMFFGWSITRQETDTNTTAGGTSHCAAEFN